jgi:hypothetical protein
MRYHMVLLIVSLDEFEKAQEAVISSTGKGRKTIFILHTVRPAAQHLGSLPSAFAGYAPLPSLALLSAFGPHTITIFGYRSVPTTLCYVGTALWVILGFLCFTRPPYCHVATGLAPSACRDIASFVPIPPNIDIVVRFLLLLTSKE